MTKKTKKVKKPEETIITTTPYGRMSFAFLTSRFAALHKIDALLAKSVDQEYQNREIVRSGMEEEGELLIRDITLTTGQVLNYHQLLAFSTGELTLEASEEMSRVIFELNSGAQKHQIKHKLDRETFNFLDYLLAARKSHPYGALNYSPTHYMSGVWSKEFGNTTVHGLLEAIYAGVVKKGEGLMNTEEEVIASVLAGKMIPLLFTQEFQDYADPEASDIIDKVDIDKDIYEDEDWDRLQVIAKYVLLGAVNTIRTEGILTIDESIISDLTAPLELLYLVSVGSLRETNMEKLFEELEALKNLDGETKEAVAAITH